MDKLKKIAVGIPSYNEGSRISFVLKQIDRGFQKHFPQNQAIILDLDGGSTDNTVESFSQTKTKTEKRVLRKEGVTGKGNVLKTFFEYMKNSEIEAGVVVDADLESITPKWLELFLNPILEKNFDYCTPLYSRHKYDGTITNNLVYPIVFGLYGVNIRQPIGGDFGFSRRLVEYWLEAEWDESTGKFGIDNFMTTRAIVGGFKICQVGLGAKIHKPSASNLNQMFLEVVETLFKNLQRDQDFLDKVEKIKEIERFGLELGEPQKLDFDQEKIKNQFKEEREKNKAYYQKVLPKNLFFKTQLPIKVDRWVDLLLWYIKNYSSHQEKKYLESLRTLYFGRAYSFIEETYRLSNTEAERLIQQQAEALFNKKDFLNG